MLPAALALTRIGRSADALKVLGNMSILHGETRGITLVRGEVLVRIGDFQAAVEAAFQAGLCEVALAQADTAWIMAPDAEKAGIEAFKSTVANGNNNCISP